MEICNYKECTGCLACVNICPVGSISVSSDERGFYIPSINSDKCVECKKCKEICPNNKPLIVKEQIQKVYAVWTRNTELRKKSTSGGFFYGIGKWIILQGGIVFGAILDKEHVVKHVSAKSLVGLQAMRGSKYVQSFIGNTYNEAKNELENGKLVLFTGTPCQIAGLYNFLGKKYKNLYTMDIICHGIPSPRIFKAYISEMERKEKSLIKDISFREKKPSWTVFSMHIKYENGKEYYKDAYNDPYLVGFLDDYLSRECCHNCKYTNESRVGDITAADFWSYVSYNKSERNDEKGISLVLVNSEKGNDIFQYIKSDYIVVNRSLKEAKRGNRCLSRPYDAASSKQKFWNEYKKTNDFLVTAKKYFPKKKKSLKHQISELINRYYYVLPKFCKKILEKYIGNKR